jgi:hypothetical protein
MPADVATSVKVKSWLSRTRRATAPNCRPTFLEAAADTAPDLGFLGKRATQASLNSQGQQKTDASM